MKKKNIQRMGMVLRSAIQVCPVPKIANTISLFFFLNSARGNVDQARLHSWCSAEPRDHSVSHAKISMSYDEFEVVTLDFLK